MTDTAPQSIEALNERYEMFCDKHNLDPMLNPDEQYDLNESQQRWIDAHITRINQARLHMVSQQGQPTPRDIDNSVPDELHVSFEDDFDMGGLYSSDINETEMTIQ